MFLLGAKVAPLALSWTLSGVLFPAIAPGFITPAPFALIQDAEKKAQETRITEEQLADWAITAPERLGSLSIGKPNNGRLLNAIRAQNGPYLELVSENFAYGTQETIDYLGAALAKVHQQYPDSPPLHLGHISKPKGGYLSPHKSHQSGRDLDIGFYYKSKRAWYRRATSKNLDLERTWAFIRALITETDVEMILVDRSLQRLLKRYAASIGEDAGWLARVFGGGKGRAPIILHAPGHATHLHIRFFNPQAQINASRAYPHLINAGLIEKVVVYARHRARRGDTLGRLARRYHTSVRAIQQANGLRNSKIVAKRVYKIPQKGRATTHSPGALLPNEALSAPSREKRFKFTAQIGCHSVGAYLLCRIRVFLICEPRIDSKSFRSRQKRNGCT